MRKNKCITTCLKDLVDHVFGKIIDVDIRPIKSKLKKEKDIVFKYCHKDNPGMFMKRSNNMYRVTKYGLYIKVLSTDNMEYEFMLQISDGVTGSDGRILRIVHSDKGCCIPFILHSLGVDSLNKLFGLNVGIYSVKKSPERIVSIKFRAESGQFIQHGWISPDYFDVLNRNKEPDIKLTTNGLNDQLEMDKKEE